MCNFLILLALSALGRKGTVYLTPLLEEEFRQFHLVVLFFLFLFLKYTLRKKEMRLPCLVSTPQALSIAGTNQHRSGLISSNASSFRGTWELKPGWIGWVPYFSFNTLFMEITELASLFQKSSFLFWNQKTSQAKETTNVFNLQ